MTSREWESELEFRSLPGKRLQEVVSQCAAGAEGPPRSRHHEGVGKRERKPKAEKAAFLVWDATSRSIPSPSGESSGGHLDTPSFRKS